MRIDFKIALYCLFGGIGSTVVAMALPLRYPNIKPLVLDIMLLGGLAFALGSILLITYELLIKPRLSKEVKLIDLLMIIVGFLLMASGTIHHFSKIKPSENKTPDKPISETVTPAPPQKLSKSPSENIFVPTTISPRESLEPEDIIKSIDQAPLLQQLEIAKNT